MKRFIIFICLFFFIAAAVFAQDGEKEEEIKTGFNFFALPVVAYDSDIGLKYGGLTNLYLFGDGSTYPQYRHSLYLEWSRTTKGSGINQIIYDSEFLIPNIRVTAEASLLTEKALDFYGFNGYEAYYTPDFEDQDNAAYKSRLYYRHERKLGRLRLDFQGPVIGRKLRWFAGFDYYANAIGPLDLEELNQGLDDEDLLPDSTLYNDYVNWGIIPEAQKDGGNTLYFKTGLVYDTRDNEPNPNSGIWSEILIATAPKFLGNSEYHYTKLAITHRQYFTLLPRRLTFAYRLSYQPKISGEMPFYMLPFVYNSKITRDGLGGAKNLRGVLRNRVVGEDIAFGNFEFRFKMLRTVIFKQNFYIALTLFTDVGLVTSKYDIDRSKLPAEYLTNSDSESWHTGYGAGLYFAVNENSVVAVNYGLAADERDGSSGLYIGLNFLF